MKKVVLFVAVLMFAGAVTISAQEAKLDVALSGNASFTFGINLDAYDPADPTNTDGTTKRIVATGISNALENKVSLTILAAADYEKGGKEGEEVYGWIKLRQIKISGENDMTNVALGDNDSAGVPITIVVRNVEAKLFLGPVYINVLGADDDIDVAGQLTELFVNSTTDHNINPAQEYAGLAVGLTDASVVSIVVGISSRFDYNDENADADDNPTTNVNTNFFNDYNLYAKVGLTAVPDLTVEASVNTSKITTTDADTYSTGLGVGGKVGYALALAEGIKLNPYVALDFGSATVSLAGVTTDVTELQLSAGLNLSLPGTMLDEFSTLGAGIDAADGVDINPGLTTVFSYDTVNNSSLTTQADANIDLGVYLFDGDLIPVLNLVAVLEIADLTADTTITGAETSQMGWGVYAEAVLDQLKPWAAFYTKSTTVAGLDYDGVLVDSFVTTDYTVLKIGVDITVITNTTFSIAYTNTGLAKVLVDGTSNSDVGTIEFTTKISY